MQLLENRDNRYFNQRRIKRRPGLMTIRSRLKQQRKVQILLNRTSSGVRLARQTETRKSGTIYSRTAKPENGQIAGEWRCL